MRRWYRCRLVVWADEGPAAEHRGELDVGRVESMHVGRGAAIDQELGQWFFVVADRDVERRPAVASTNVKRGSGLNQDPRYLIRSGDGRLV